MKKKRVLICGEYSRLGTGYSNWSFNLLQGLYLSNKYELAEFATFCNINTCNHNNPWKVYPNNVDNHDTRIKQYNSGSNNIFGQWRFDKVCLHFQPDIVIDFRDPWMFEFESYSPLREYYKWLIMPPVDSIPQKNEWITIFNNADLIIPYTDWAKQYLQQYKHLKLYSDISPAGVNTDIFKPQNVDRELFGLPDQKFIIGSVMRNQKRKLIPALFEVMSKLDENYILYLHTTYPEPNGWNIPELLLEYNLQNRVYFTYKCKYCHTIRASKYVKAVTKCKSCGKGSCTIASTNSGIPETKLSEIYNCFDIYIQYANCEGFGMPQIEAGACGIPVCSVDYSAMSEVVRNISGFPISCASLSYELESGAKRAYPNIEETINLINRYKNLSSQTKNDLSKKTRELTKEYYSWSNIVDTWMSAIDSIDISTNKQWNNNEKYVLNSKNYLSISDNYDFLEQICVLMLKSPFLLKTQMIQHMLYGLDHGSIRNETFTKESVLKNLTNYAQQKEHLDKLRLKELVLDEDYLKI